MPKDDDSALLVESSMLVKEAFAAGVSPAAARRALRKLASTFTEEEWRFALHFVEKLSPSQRRSMIEAFSLGRTVWRE